MSDLLRQIERKVDEYGVTGNDDSGVMYETLQEMARDLVEQERRIAELEADLLLTQQVREENRKRAEATEAKLWAVLDLLTYEDHAGRRRVGILGDWDVTDDVDAIIKEDTW